MHLPHFEHNMNLLQNLKQPFSPICQCLSSGIISERSKDSQKSLKKLIKKVPQLPHFGHNKNVSCKRCLWHFCVYFILTLCKISGKKKQKANPEKRHYRQTDKLIKRPRVWIHSTLQQSRGTKIARKVI